MIKQKNTHVNKNQNKKIPDWRSHPEIYFKQLKNSGLRSLINLIAGYSNIHDEVYPAQSTLGNKIDRSRGHTNRLVQKAIALGMLHIIKRPYSSNIYRLSPIFNSVPFRQRLMKLMPSFWYLPLVLLVSLSTGTHPLTAKNHLDNRSRSTYVTQYIQRYPLFIKTMSSTLKREASFFGKYTATDKNGNVFTRSYRKTGDMLMEEKLIAQQNVFSDMVQLAADQLKLTIAGMCNVAAYEDTVIATALKLLQNYRGKVQKPYGLFIKLCNEVAAEQNTAPQRSKSFQLAEQLGVNIRTDDVVVPGAVFTAARLQSNSKTQQTNGAFSGHSSSHTNLPQKSTITPSTKRYAYSLEELRQLNPDLNLDNAEFDGPRTIKVHVHNDHEWRPTTQEERIEWNRRITQELTPEGKAFLERTGISVPIAPDVFKGDPNTYSPKVYYMSRKGILYTHPRLRDEADLKDHYVQKGIPDGILFA